MKKKLFIKGGDPMIDFLPDVSGCYLPVLLLVSQTPCHAHTGLLVSLEI